MANIAATYTATFARRFAGPEGKSFLLTTGTLVVTSPGGTNAGEFPASIFGLSTFIGDTNFVKSDNSVTAYGLPEATAGQSLITVGQASSGPGVPADLAVGTYTATATGISA